MGNICKFYNLNEMDTNSIVRKISEMVERERQIYGVKNLDDYILSIGLDVYGCIKNHCLKKHIFDNPPIYESGIICSPYMHYQLEFEVLTPDVFSPWIVILRKKSEPFTLYRKTLRNSTYDLRNDMLKSSEALKDAKASMNSVFDLKLHNSKMLEYAANDVETIKTLYNKIYKLEQKYIKNVIFNDPATIVFWNDGTKTVVKVTDNETFDPEKGLAMAIAKGYFGNHGNYYNEFKKWLPVEKTKWKDPVEKVCSSCKYFVFSSIVEPCHSCLIDGDSPNWQRADK